MIGLTDAEQENVLAAMDYLRVRSGGWKPLAKVLGYARTTIWHVKNREKKVSSNVALRVARVAGVSVDDVLSGTWPPPGACPHCGRSSTGQL